MFAAGKAVSSADPTDAQFNYVTMLLHGDGTNGAQNNTFLDSSTNAFTITRNGNTTQGTFTPYGSNWSNYFDGATDYLSAANATALQLSANQFTLEGWFYFTTSGVDNYIISQTSGSLDANVNWFIRVTTANNLRFLVMTSGATAVFFDGTTTITANTWHHFAATCDGTGAGANMRSWVDGVYQGGTTVNAANINTNVGQTQVGSWSYNANYSTGYVSNVRVLKGTALYTGTSNITVPTAPLTAITNTSLLTCQSNCFIDNSTNNFTITKNGDVSVQRFSPFSPTTAYSTSVIGGSGYFDGTGDYLSTSGSIGSLSGNFTIECWSYLTASGSYPAYWTLGDSKLSTGIELQATTTNVYLFTNNALLISGASTTPLNTWVHWALVRSGTTVTLYKNGVSFGTATSSATFSGVFYSGAEFYNGAIASANLMYGYLSDTRVVNGTAQYTTAFTPPTAPLTAITNTSLLLNYTNAGILDNAMMNDLETVGNAQISTSVVKYGTGSLAFDGTDDRLTSASSPNIAFGTGDFTVEAWIYTNTLSGERGFIQTSDTAGGLKTTYTTGIIINIDISPYKINCNIGGTGVNSGTTYVAINTWYHIALTRASGSVRLFINGALVGGPTTITTDLTGQNICVGGYYNTSYLWNGYIDDLRITKGVARYTTTFTPATAAFPNN